MLARASTRHRELAVRLAIGAGRGRMTRQLLAEALVLAWPRRASAMAIAFGGRAGRSPRCSRPTCHASATSQVDGRAGLRAWRCGRSPPCSSAWSPRCARRRTKLRESLGEGSARWRRRTRRTRAAGARRRAGRLTIVLLVGAGLLARSFVRVLAVDPGYSTTNALILDLSWTFARDPQDAAPPERAARDADAARPLPASSAWAYQRVSARRRELHQRPLHRDDAAGRDHEPRRLHGSATR